MVLCRELGKSLQAVVAGAVPASSPALSGHERPVQEREQERKLGQGQLRQGTMQWQRGAEQEKQWREGLKVQQHETKRVVQQTREEMDQLVREKNDLQTSVKRLDARLACYRQQTRRLLRVYGAAMHIFLSHQVDETDMDDGDENDPC